MPGGRTRTPGASYKRTWREQDSQGDREARLDRQRLLTNHLTPRQRWVPQLVLYIVVCSKLEYDADLPTARLLPTHQHSD